MKYLSFRLFISPVVIVFLVIAGSCSKTGDQGNNNPPGDTTRLPVVTTSVVTAIEISTATGGGNITSDGGSAITARGVCWSSTHQFPTLSDHVTHDSSGKGTYTSYLTGLPESSHVWVVAYATNSKGTSYGNLIRFSTKGSQGNMVDNDGKVYPTIRIGGQVWMAKNLQTKHYYNGAYVENVTDPAVWMNMTTGAYCFYNMNPSYEGIYGLLYNWYAITDPRGLAPPGWHVPTRADFDSLINFLGYDVEAGGKMKEAGTAHWRSPNTGATNESGFTALPGGSTNFNDMGYSGFWWTVTEQSQSEADVVYLNYYIAGTSGAGGGKTTGYSVRLVKN